MSQAETSEGSRGLGCPHCDPTNSSTLYAGTGEGFGNADAIRGRGIPAGHYVVESLMVDHEAKRVFSGETAITVPGGTVHLGTD